MVDPVPFRVAIVPGVTVSKWTRIWTERHPRIPIEVVPTDVAALASEIRVGAADIGFARLPVADGDPRLSVIPLWSERTFVVVPREHPVSVFESVTLADVADETVLEGDADGVVAAVGAGAGVALLPQSLARLHARRDVVARPVTDGEESRIALVWLADGGTEHIEDFVGIVRGRTANSSRGAASTPTPPRSPVRSPSKGGPGSRSAPRRRRR